MFLGFAGEGFKQEGGAPLKPGEQFSVSHFTIKHDALRVTSDSQKQMITGHVTLDDGKPIATMTPAKWPSTPRRSRPPRSRFVAAVGEDLYRPRRLRRCRTERDLRRHDQSAGQLDLARLRDHGGSERASRCCRKALAFAAAKVPSAAATARCFSCCCSCRRLLRAECRRDPRRAAQAARRRDPLHLRLPPADERLSDGTELPRTGRAAVKLDKYVGDGMDRDQVLAAFAPTMARRRSWPGRSTRASIGWRGSSLQFGVSGAVGAVVIARRWSRRSSPQILRPPPRRMRPPHPVGR